MKYLIGIQPTGKVHIGNYLGCIAKGLRLQDEGHEVTFLIANYHSLTTDSYSDTTEMELRRLGCKNIKRQTPDYTELFFRLCCKVNLGALLKMPQYKDKKDSVEFDMGLLLYPVLMAADIVINDPDVVIVGRDQVAHLELTNDIAKRIGVEKKFEFEFGDADKIMSLMDPTLKMSKSSGDKHVLYMFDEDYDKKLKSANMDELGFANIKKIGDHFGVEFKGMNSAYKSEIANEMKKRFGNV
jgi:tryptophanyl-tRNA synthetase